MAFPVPPDEVERLEDVQALPVEALEGSSTLERLVAIAARVTGCPWAAVTLVGDEDQQVLAEVGSTLSRVTARERSICAHAITKPGTVLVVQDTRESDVLGDLPLPEGHRGLRFYAGAPLRSQRGHGIGTLCVARPEPSELKPEQRRTLEDLAEIASADLRTRGRLERLEDTNERLDRFAAMVSHELIDPISQVVMNLELLSDEASKLDEPARNRLEQAAEGGRRAENLTRDLLDYARAVGEPVEREPVDLGGLVEDVVESLEPRIGEVDGSVRVEALPTVRADPDLVRQVVRNLVANALQHAGPEPNVTIRAAFEPGLVRVIVEDGGPGIPPDERDEVFDLFTRDSQASGSSTGVGLAFCQRVIERQGGQLGVDDSPQGGAAFWFTLPVDEA